MNHFSMLVLPILLLVTGACGGSPTTEPHTAHSQQEMTGAHGGRLLQTDGLSVEVTIFETGVPPEFRLYVLAGGKPVDPTQLDLHITLTRLGGITDEIAFVAEDDYFRGDTEIYEPHSFAVEVTARYQGKQHQWHYDSFEGRTRISAQMARNTGIGIETAGSAIIRDYVSVYGQVVSHPENISHVVARFDGVIQAVHASIGDQVAAGDVLATIEANDSLNNYDITSPITGTLVERHANRGEATAGRTLFTLIDTRTVWAELAVFPSDRPRIQVGAPVTIRTAIGNLEANGNISLLSPVLAANQAATARVPLANPDGLLTAGMFLTGEIEVSRTDVPLAVRRSALQPFRDFTVVFAQFGDEYEVRMLELGRQDDEWVEVLSGLRLGTRYVTENSYILKADVEKSGASHDH